MSQTDIELQAGDVEQDPPAEVDETKDQFVTVDENTKPRLEPGASKELDIPNVSPLLSHSVTQRSTSSSRKEEQQETSEDRGQDRQGSDDEKKEESDSRESREKKSQSEEAQAKEDKASEEKSEGSETVVQQKITRRVTGFRRISITKVYNEAEKKKFIQNIEKAALKKNESSDLLSSRRTVSDKTLNRMKSKECPSDSSMLNLREDIDPIQKLRTVSFENEKSRKSSDQKNYQSIEDSQDPSQAMPGQFRNGKWRVTETTTST